MTTDTAAAQLARLTALEEIRALKHRYVQAADRKDLEVFRTCFIAEGAVCDYGPLGRFEGRDALVAMFGDVALKKREDGKGYAVFDMHTVGAPVIDVQSDDEAAGTWSMRFRQIDTEARTETVSAMEYADTYRREDGEWRIATSVVKVLWASVRPLPEDVGVFGMLD
ncbi:nuclear transport factor 2 family protein [Nocardioides massiliensis]|uniref:SnoaL-like domain-containing protein n=1 Tax=Nocardioides massiliensis TaxID=1325935 RepID=A0ABT9NPB5_9ACTN|nr:nuclear transport factor 2 family protein [Nocardioides massiliensis]MDP9822281.1 hypothetical protein [Nocardioides massiliensis]